MFEPRPGIVVLSRYTLERQLARGGMSTIWVAHDDMDEREVAVKLLLERWAGSKEVRGRFQREAMAIQSLSSPNIISVFDHGVVKDTPVIVMQLLAGEDLRQRLSRERKLSLAQLAPMVAQACAGLRHAHENGVLHRDLKPANVFIAKENDKDVIKLLDFGVAKATSVEDDLSFATRVGSMLGTPQFMSPEQSRDAAEVDQRSDVWSLGVILYRAVTGQLPFDGATPGDVVVKVCTESPLPPSHLVVRLPDEVDEFFEKALARDPNRRFESADAFAKAFAALVTITRHGSEAAFDGSRPLDASPARWLERGRSRSNESIPPAANSAPPRSNGGPVSIIDTESALSARPRRRSIAGKFLIGATSAAVMIGALLFARRANDPPIGAATLGGAEPPGVNPTPAPSDPRATSFATTSALPSASVAPPAPSASQTASASASAPASAASAPIAPRPRLRQPRRRPPAAQPPSAPPLPVDPGEDIYE